MYRKERSDVMDVESINVSKLLIEFKPLIYKTLGRLRIHPNHMNFDDFFQELQIKLVEIYRTFDGDPLHVETDRYKFTAFAGNGLYWRGIDLFKKKNFSTLPVVEDVHLERMVERQEAAGNLPESNVFLDDFLSQAKSRLSESEFLLFTYLAEGDYTITEIADLMQVSRGTIYNRRNNMQVKIQDIKHYLTGA